MKLITTKHSSYHLEAKTTKTISRDKQIHSIIKNDRFEWS